jgi:hypothetical protein
MSSLSQSVTVRSPGVPGDATPTREKRLGKLSLATPVLVSKREKAQMTNTNFAVVRGQQVLAFLLATIPVAERMLLYHVVMSACLMLPQRGSSQSSVS